MRCDYLMAMTAAVADRVAHSQMSFAHSFSGKFILVDLQTSQLKAGYTPLHTACHFGKLNMIEFLLKKGANVEAVTKVFVGLILLL